MRDYRLTVFEKSNTDRILRFHGEEEKERPLKPSEIDELVAEVAKLYSQDALAPLDHGSRSLVELGQKLYTFLDNDERWLAKEMTDPPGTILRIDTDERLRHLPWELLAGENGHLAVGSNAPFTPARAVPETARKDEPSFEQHNRPLRILFMAASPEGVRPVLDFEDEERQILQATTTSPAELVVEESGTIEGLAATAADYGAGHFDVFHISGHADVKDNQPYFVLEDRLGRRSDVTPEQITKAIGNKWPRLVFASGCLTGDAPDHGNLPSMAETLVRAGAPAVLGWALPVGDNAASLFASHLYQYLASGNPIPESVAHAREMLFAEAKSPFWHYLRLYTTRTKPLGPIVTPRNTKGRTKLRVRPAADEWLDPETRLSPVAPRTEFVGRRRLIQRCLRVLTADLNDPDGGEGLVLHGMGGLGKSTLASRLLDRMPEHQRVVFFKGVDIQEFNKLVDKLSLPDAEQEKLVGALLNDQQLNLDARLRRILDGPLADENCLFVFDDFENGNLEERDGGHVCKRESGEVLGALMRAIRATGSESRVIITSRYRFPAPQGTKLVFEALETMRDNELAKKIDRLEHLSPKSDTPAEIRSRAIAAAEGIPRLLDWLDKVVEDKEIDLDALITPIEEEAERYRRENIFAQTLLDMQPKPIHKMLAKLNVVQLPVPKVTVLALHDHEHAEDHLERAVSIGLVEGGLDPETGDQRFYVSNVLQPLVSGYINDDEYKAACAAAARSLYDEWGFAQAAEERDAEATEPEPGA